MRYAYQRYNTFCLWLMLETRIWFEEVLMTSLSYTLHDLGINRSVFRECRYVPPIHAEARYGRFDSQWAIWNHNGLSEHYNRQCYNNRTDSSTVNWLNLLGMIIRPSGKIICKLIQNCETTIWLPKFVSDIVTMLTLPFQDIIPLKMYYDAKLGKGLHWVLRIIST
jgi:hypothetical protein